MIIIMRSGYSLVFNLFLIFILNLVVVNAALSAYPADSNPDYANNAEPDYGNISGTAYRSEEKHGLSNYYWQYEIKKYEKLLILPGFLFVGFENPAFLVILTQLNTLTKIGIRLTNVGLWYGTLKKIVKQNLYDNDNNFKNPSIDIRNPYIDLQGKTLSLIELQDLWQEVEGSSIIGHIRWGGLPEEAKELKEKIENKIIQNNKQYNRYPTDFIHALLSARIYTDHEENTEVRFDDKDENGIYNKYLQDWETHKIYKYPEAGGYYGATYINRKDQQLVLAHRGTTLKWFDLIDKDSPTKTDLKGILGGAIVAQQVAAYRAVKQAITDAKDLHYNLSVTGHSLGGWLAELSLYFCYRDFDCPNVKAVTFDSPGSVMHMEQLKSNIINHTTELDIENLDIVTYLSTPNFVNSCNKHVGRVYRIFSEISKPEPIKKIIGWSNWFGEIFSWNKREDNSLAALWSIFGHSLNPLLASFNPESGKPLRYQEILDWPVIKYTPREKKGENLITVWIDSVHHLLSPKELIGLQSSITDSTVVTLVTVLGEIIDGRLDQKQYLNYFKYIEQDNNEESAKEGYQVKEKLSENEQFSLTYEGHYRTGALNLFEDVLVTDNKGSADWYLKELKKKSLDQLDEELSRKQLSELKDQYTIIPNNKNLISSDTTKIDSLREWILRLVSVNPEIRTMLENPILFSTINKADSNNILANYLPQDRISNFIEQEQVFDSINVILDKQQYVVISGLPGSGKSSCALEYAYRQKNKVAGGRIVRWLSADSADKIDMEYRNLAIELGIPVNSLGKNKQVVINLVNNKVANLKSQLLLIFDYVEEYNHIKDYIINLPPQVKVMVTTRDDSLVDNIKQVRLNPFNRAEAQIYITKSLEDRVSDKDVRALIEVLGTKDGEILPYTLSQAVAYIRNNELSTIEKCIENIEKNPNDQTKAALLLQLLEQSPLALDILQYSSRLDPDFISIEIFKELFMVDDEKLKEPIKKLTSLSLVNVVGKNERGLKLHRLVQDEMLKYVIKHAKTRYIIKQEVINKNILQALNNLLPKVTKVPDKDWKIATLFYPHVNKMLQQNWKENLAVQAELYSKLGRYNEYVIHKFKQCLEYEETGLKIKQMLFPANHHSIAISLSDIGFAYRNLGDTQKGLTFQEQALKMRQKLYKGNHPELANSLSVLGEFYRILGNAEKGLEFHKQTLKMRQVLYKGNHCKIANSLDHIGESYWYLDHVQSGLSYYQQALKMRQELYQDNHPDVARSLHNIGKAYYRLGNVQEALIYSKQALKMRRELYQDNHPDVADSLNNIGSIYYGLGDGEQALIYQEQALKVRQILYQGNNSDIAMSLNNIGSAYQILGNGQKAMEFHEQALTMYQFLYQGNHPKIAWLLNSIGEVYQLLGDTQKALIYYEQSLKMYQTLYQGNHSNIALSLDNIGVAYQTLGEAQKALTYHERALKMGQQLREGNHPDVARSFNNIGECYQTLGDMEKAMTYYQQALKMRQELYQGNHPDTITSLKHVGLVYQILGNKDQAIAFYKQAYNLITDSLGVNHPSAQKLQENIAVLEKSKQ